MSKVYNIFEIIKNEKVEWKKIGEVCEVVTDYVAAGSFKSIAENVNYLSNPDYAQLIRTKDIKSNFKNKDFVFVDKKAFDYLYRVNLNVECLILPNIGNCGEVYHILPEKLPYKNNVLGPNAIFLQSKNSNIRFLYYLLLEKWFQKELYKITSKTGQGKFNKTDLKQIQIPIPSLETQQKIVEILDKFTSYVTELQAELQQRTKQYEYYRNLLLSEEYLNKLSENPEILGGGYRLRVTTLGEVAQINRGASPRPISKYLTDDENGISWIKIGDIELHSKYVIKTAQKITVEGAKKSRVLKEGDFIISNSMSYGRPYILNIKGAIHDGWASISDFDEYLDSDFLYHFLSSSTVQNYWKAKINSSSVSNLNSEIIRSLPVPIIDKGLQKKIAEILDKFQSLLSDTKGLLPEEIKQRQKQYEYYREKLLTFTDVYASTHARTIIPKEYILLLQEAADIVGISLFEKVEWKKLGEVFEIRNGYTPSKQNIEFWDGGTIPWFRMDDLREQGKILKDSKQHITEKAIKGKGLFKANSIILATTATIGEHAILTTESLANQQFTNFSICKLFENRLLPKYVFYYFDIIDEWCKRNTKTSSLPAVNMDSLIEFQIPIPPLKVQEHIVSKLDVFDALVNDISKGLPKEIELRQKQYEYYREKLLGFKL